MSPSRTRESAPACRGRVREEEVGVINIECENIEFENCNIEKQSGELKVKFSVMRKWGTSLSNLTEPC